MTPTNVLGRSLTASDWAKVSAVLSELFERLPTLPDLLFQHCLEHSWLYGTKALGSPEAGVRHMGAASRLDPCLYRLHIVPPSFAPMPMPAVAAPVAEAPGTPLATPGPRMALEAPDRDLGLDLRHNPGGYGRHRLGHRNLTTGVRGLPSRARSTNCSRAPLCAGWTHGLPSTLCVCWCIGTRTANTTGRP